MKDILRCSIIALSIRLKKHLIDGNENKMQDDLLLLQSALMLDPVDLHWEVLRETYRQIVLFIDLKKKHDKNYSIANLKGLILINSKALNKQKPDFSLDNFSKECL